MSMSSRAARMAFMAPVWTRVWERGVSMEYWRVEGSEGEGVKGVRLFGDEADRARNGRQRSRRMCR